jgi:hypothetical protein
MLTKSPLHRAGLWAVAVLSTAFLATGCSDKATLFPNPDPSLRKTRTELRTDASQRFPYKADAPHLTDRQVRGQVRYSLNRLELLNFTGEELADVEVWVNRKYVCFVPKMQDRKLKEVQFTMLMDEQGKPFPGDNRIVRVETVELFRGGAMHQITCHLAEF